MRARDTVEAILKGWRDERNAVEERLARLRLEQGRETSPNLRVQLAREIGQLEEQLAIIQGEEEPLTAELAALDKDEQARLAKAAKLTPKGSAAFRAMLQAADAFEEQVRACLELEGQCRQLGVVQGWPAVPRGFVSGLMQGRRELQTIASVGRMRDELIQSRAKQGGSASKGGEERGALHRWSELREWLSGE